MAFSGARAGEVLQLLGRDVRQEGDLWVIDVNERGDGKSVKTGNPRNVPVHPALLREGFVAYAQTVAPDAPLFPEKALDKHGNRGGRAWNVVGLWVRKVVGITDPQKAPDHSWRHRVEDELRAAEAPEDARDAILGHARKLRAASMGCEGRPYRGCIGICLACLCRPAYDLPLASLRDPPMASRNASIRKTLRLRRVLWEELEALQRAEGLPSLSAAVRRALDAGLDAADQGTVPAPKDKPQDSRKD